jgi:hypothetical protein
MQKYPVLALILRFGGVGAIALAVICGLLIVALGWAALGWFAIVLAILGAGLVFLIAKSYVEIVTIITEMLVPQ